MYNMDPTPDRPSLQLFSLAGKNVLITGATRGIGAACAIALAQAGAAICLVQRPGNRPNVETVNTIRGLGGNVNVVECDLGDMDAVRGLFDRALAAMEGSIHVLVNCAGIQRRSPSVDFLERDWDDVLDVNLKSVWLLSQAAGRHMVPLRRGKIINFCSLLTFQGGITVPAYASAKGALGQLTKALSNEWSQFNIQVNGICPGYIATDMYVHFFWLSFWSFFLRGGVCFLAPIRHPPSRYIAAASALIPRFRGSQVHSTSSYLACACPNAGNNGVSTLCIGMNGFWKTQSGTNRSRSGSPLEGGVPPATSLVL
ncbi:hypothetical protein EDC04DRAFT_2673420 [Pisolithus marmoratus]|nr:hypothetical protein EDC04DRAFT_2673420 [Pisolithus marmoratus]